MSKLQIMPLGYADPATERIVKELMSNDDHWLLIDIRYKNVAGRWFPLWSGDHLNTLYRERYLHVPEFGNLNYKNKHLPHVIANPEIGLSIIRREMDRGHNLILLCACKHYYKCHRKDVVELIQAAMPEVEVIMPELCHV